jgi:RNA polymerase sigma factor (sigma-70 family)
MRKVAVPPPAKPAERVVAKRAFDVVWEEYEDELRRRCGRWMGSAELGEEAFCRAAMLAFQKYAQHAGSILDARSWLITVVHNACMNFHRERKRDRFELFDTVDTQRLTARGNPEKDMIRGELATLLRRAVAELPPRLRVPLELVVYEEQSYREVARLLDVTEPSLRKRMQQARTRVRARLRAYDKGRPPRAAQETGAKTRTSASSLRYLLVQPVTRPDGTKIDVERFTDELPLPGGEPELRRLERHVARHAGGWKMRVRLARALLTAGETEASIAQYRTALLRRPDRDALALELAAILCARGDTAEADHLRTAALQAASDNDAALLDAHEALRAGRVSDAIARLEPLAGAEHAIALTFLGDALRAIGMPARARACSAMSVEPSRVFVHAAATVEEHALALIARGETTRALEEIRAFAMREPLYAGAWLAFARVSAAAGCARDAVAAAVRAHVLDPASPATTVEAARIVVAFDAERAAAIVATAPRSWPAAVVACEIEARRGTDTAHGEALAAAVIALEPSLAMSWIRAAQVLLAAGALEGALTTFARGLSLLPDDDGASLGAAAAEGIATAYELLGEPAAAALWRRSTSRVS